MERGERGDSGIQGAAGALRFSKPQLVAFLLVVAVAALSVWLVTHEAHERRQAIVKSGNAVATVGCNRDFKQTEVLREELMKSQERTQLLVDEGTLTQKQADRAVAQTDKLLERYVLPDCRIAANTLTEDPDKDVKQPVPLHP